MTTRSAAGMGAGSAPRPGSAGVTIIEPKALRSLVSAITAELLGVRARDIKAEFSDAHGELGLAVVTPCRAEPLGRDGAMTLVQRADLVARELAERLRASARREVGRVEIRFSRIAIEKEGRVQ